MKPTQGPAIIARSATLSSTEPMKRTPSSQCKCSAISRQTNFQPPRWCCHGVSFPAFSFLAGLKGPRVSMDNACACGSPCPFRRKSLLISPFYFRDAPGVTFGAKIILSPTRLTEFDHQRSFCLDLLEKIGKVLPRAVVDQVGTLFKAMAPAILQRLHERAVERKLRPEHGTQVIRVPQQDPHDIVVVQSLHMAHQRLGILLREDLIGGAESGKAARRVQSEEVARLQFPGYVAKFIHRIDVLATGKKVPLVEIESDERI